MSSAQNLPTRPQPDLDEVRDLVRRYNADEPAARQEMLQRLRDPKWIDHLGGDLRQHVETALVTRLKALPQHEINAIIAKAHQLRSELAHRDEPALLRLLADRAVTCWMHLHMLEFYAACIDRYESAQHYEKLTDRAHRRYLASLSTLASVRKMGVPMIQVNVAEKQVVVGDGVMEGRERRRKRKRKRKTMIDTNEFEKKIKIRNKNMIMIEAGQREEIVEVLAEVPELSESGGTP